jgi:formate hydrogenlyase transcriptional activator
MPSGANAPDKAPLPTEVAGRYQALIRLTEAIRSHANPADSLQSHDEQLQEFVSFDAIARFDSATNQVQWQFRDSYEASPEVLARAQKDESVPRWVHRYQQPLALQIGQVDPRFPAVGALGELGLRSLFALPMSTAHRQLGSLVFVSHDEGAYPADEQQFLSLLATHLAVAMDDALNFQASQHAQDRLKLLLEVTNRVVSKLELTDLLREISANIRRVLQCDVVGVRLPDPETGELLVKAIDSRSELPRDRRPCLAPPAEAVFRTGKLAKLTKEEIAEDPRIAAAGTKSLCMLPLISHEHVLGVLGLGSVHENAFSEDDLRFLSQVANQIALAVENALAYGEISQLKDRLARENVYLESEIRSELHFDEIVGTSKALKRVLADVETVATTDATVLIYGETGTGKELIARAVHNLSSRKSNAFVKLNCAAIPTGLLESELFGHEKGAFTGAISQRIGRFELAHRGTIFLDEVGEIPLDLQPKLLRVLQEHEFERLGSSRTFRSDARLIAATNRDLKAMVDDQKFRSDLFYRLNVFPIRVPSLRDRKEDIPLLVRHFVQEFSRRNNRAIDTIPSEAMEALIRYPWPGNIRELQNVIERAVIVSRGPVLTVVVSELEAAIATKPASGSNEALQDMLDETQRTQILRALEQANWVISGPNGAAARLGMKRSTFQFRMQKLGIRVSRTALHEKD